MLPNLIFFADLQTILTCIRLYYGGINISRTKSSLLNETSRLSPSKYLGYIVPWDGEDTLEI